MSAPFVPLYRQFPTDDAHNLEKQLVNFHVQTNTAVNNRTISTFQLHVVGTNDAIPDGERWFPAAGDVKLRDGNRLVVQVSDANLTVNHNIPLINQVTRLYGAFLDGAGVWNTLPYVDLVAVANQIKITVSATQIIVTKGGGAPAINSGIVVLEYL
jgi:hypothetical protein